MAGATDVKPAFQVEKVTGNFMRTIMHIIEDVRKVGPNQDKSIITRKLEPKQEVFHEGYMVYFPQGHSMFIAADDEDQLVRVGVKEQPKFVDMNTGEEVPDELNLSPKDIVERKQRNRPRSTGGLTDVMEGNL
jgi:hypothetical protein